MCGTLFAINGGVSRTQRMRWGQQRKKGRKEERKKLIRPLVNKNKSLTAEDVNWTDPSRTIWACRGQLFGMRQSQWRGGAYEPTCIVVVYVSPFWALPTPSGFACCHGTRLFCDEESKKRFF
ncbi:hypothetical protein VFPPC_17642 [Pochonia chlamydosporia 170]|uniref:Uncharacterized protein n=1 Tax=Pochonia chlamydosporia 170 TaxID=1380566 RepID=A0A219ARE9_METCM|nr:hypothetical protein VFPPC_17642 [Pochonia chlamydosporia 170]OWT43182.1 hypothetical protein VFPPC_17642 [Pochonia chlamydosporia 170]